ncbi:uncharacterized protein LOC142174577 [Nicotiana tabacum]|uniref:Uncharacterized protein LOC142174577 n=1 Tax=Nicotiana tabacum TaxID=4097 RepID=A0AC58TH11_TOBAC
MEKSKLGFVDGTCVKTMFKGELAEQWEKCNAIVLSWIGSTIADELIPSIIFVSGARKVWGDFKERIASLKQGTDSMTTYYSKMNDLWSELDVLVPLSSCDCEEARPSIEHLANQRLL